MGGCTSATTITTITTAVPSDVVPKAPSFALPAVVTSSPTPTGSHGTGVGAPLPPKRRSRPADKPDRYLLLGTAGVGKTHLRRHLERLELARRRTNTPPDPSTSADADFNHNQMMQYQWEKVVDTVIEVLRCAVTDHHNQYWSWYQACIRTPDWHYRDKIPVRQFSSPPHQQQ